MTFDYFYGAEADQFSFYRIPKILFTDKHFSNISTEAKILYGLLLDRMSLSIKNGWTDEGKVYIIYTVSDIMDALCCATQKAVKLLGELDKYGLIERKRQGLGKPNLIFVMNLISVQQSQFKNCENQNSGIVKIKIQEFPKSKSNNTNINNTDINDTDSIRFTSFSDERESELTRSEPKRHDEYAQIIRDNISFNALEYDYPDDKDVLEEITELIVDTVSAKKPTIRISGDDKPAELIRSRFFTLNSEHIRFILDNLRNNTTSIRNMKQYLLAALYNAPMTIANAYRCKVRHDMNAKFSN